MKLVEMGKGGMARVKEILKEQFSSQTAVAMFRVTAVDDRENTVSYRTKLIHVIYTGPDTPVMKRAKITPFNAAFKQPFTFNLSIQTSDEDSDLSEATIEKSLRASGGAHQPTRFDFTNCSAPGEGESKIMRKSEARSPSHASPSPVPSSFKSSPAPAQQEEQHLSADEVMQRHIQAYDARDAEKVSEDYTADAQLVHTDATARQTTIYNGPAEIAQFFQAHFDIIGSNDPAIDKMDTKGSIITLEWSNQAAGIAYAMDVFYVTKGKFALQTITTVSAVSSDEAAAPQEATEEPAEPTLGENEEPGMPVSEQESGWEAVESSDAPAAEEYEAAPPEEEPAQEEEAAAQDEYAEEPQEAEAGEDEAQYEEQQPGEGDEQQYGEEVQEEYDPQASE